MTGQLVNHPDKRERLDPELSGGIKQLLRDIYQEDIDEFIDSYDETKSHPLKGEVLEIDIQTLKEYGQLYWYFKNEARTFEYDITEYIRARASELDDGIDYDIKHPDDGHWDIRWFNPPDDLYTDLSNSVGDNIGKIVAFEGRVRTKSEPATWMSKTKFRCNRCGLEQSMSVPTSRVELVSNIFNVPLQCEREQCNGTSLTPVREQPAHLSDNEVRDCQYLSVEQTVSGKSTPHRISCWLFGQGRVQENLGEGERITVVGRFRLERDEENPSPDYWIEVLGVNQLRGGGDESVEITDNDVEYIHQMVDDMDDPLKQAAESLAPTVYGENEAKQGLILNSVGAGLDKRLHTLMIGDPSTAKSYLSSRVRKLVPSSRSASGSQSSDAGLIAATVQEKVAGGNETWVVKGGPLVLAGGSILTIDELDNADFDLSKLNEAMEGSIDLAKAGNQMTLETDTRVIAAANPRGSSFDPTESLDDQLQFADDIVSRFGLIYPFVDDQDNKERNDGIMDVMGDRFLSQYGDEDEQEETELAPVEFETLKKWIALSSENDPVMTAEVKQVISRNWTTLRSGSNTSINLDTRDAATLYRLSKAHARLRFADEITAYDAQKACEVYTDMLALWDWGVEGEGLTKKQVREYIENNPDEEPHVVAEHFEDEFDEDVSVTVYDVYADVNQGGSK